MSQLRIYRFPEWQETPYRFVELKRRTDSFPEEKAEPVPHDGRMDESLSRSRRLIQEYVLCNSFSLFCTFTFSDAKVNDRTDYKAIKSKLCKAFNNFKNRHDPTFKYLVVPELHKDGAVHFHGVITTPVGLCSPLLIPKRGRDGTTRMVNNTPGYMDWPYYSERFGFFSCSWIRNYTGCAVYVSKYMTKDLAAWFEKNDQIVMHSKGLNRPELVYMADNEKIPGKLTRDDYDGEFCTVAMRDIWQTAPYYIHWADEFTLRPQNVIAPEDLWKYQQWQNYPGIFDNFEQTSLRAKNYTQQVHP